mgnify:CR=1 FL=1
MSLYPGLAGRVGGHRWLIGTAAFATQGRAPGDDAIWLGVVITILIEIGQVTPPVGLNLSVLVSVTKEKVSLGEAAVATIPYWLILLSGILLLALMPQIALFLPSVLM